MFLQTNIKALRKYKGWKQAQLAEKLDKTYITVGDYERGKIVPPLPVILKLCAIFGVDLETIIFHDIENEGLSAKIRAAEALNHLQQDLHTQRQINHLQAQRLAELEREIREHAPELARRLRL